MRDLERRIGKLENEKSAEEDFQLVIIDETLPDGTMIHNGRPAVVRPGMDGLIIHKRARHGCDTQIIHG